MTINRDKLVPTTSSQTEDRNKPQSQAPRRVLLAPRSSGSPREELERDFSSLGHGAEHGPRRGFAHDQSGHGGRGSAARTNPVAPLLHLLSLFPKRPLPPPRSSINLTTPFGPSDVIFSWRRRLRNLRRRQWRTGTRLMSTRLVRPRTPPLLLRSMRTRRSGSCCAADDAECHCLKAVAITNEILGDAGKGPLKVGPKAMLNNAIDTARR